MKIERITDKTTKFKIGLTDVALYMLDRHNAVMVDTGQKEMPEFIQYLEEHDINVKTAICTHSHYDHMMNNQLLIDRFGTEIIINERDFRDSQMWGWKYTYEPSFINAGDEVCVDGQIFKTIGTPGHSNGHCMVVLPDGVCYVGDAFIPIWTLKYAKMPFVTNLEDNLSTLQMIRGMDYELFLMSHFGIVRGEEMPAHIDANINKYLQDMDAIAGLAAEPVERKELMYRFIESVGLSREKADQRLDYRFTADRRIECALGRGLLHKQGELLCSRA